MIGIGFDINAIDESVLGRADIINLENPLYTNYFYTDYAGDIARFNQKKYPHRKICDGAYIDLNPAATERDIADIVEKKVLLSIDFAKATGCEEIIFLSTFLPMIGMAFYDDAFAENSIRFWRGILEKTDIARISLCNTFEYTPDLLIKIARGADDKRFGLTVDIGHALAYSKIPLDEFYTAAESYTQTVYLHSNNGYADEHLNIFEGVLGKREDFLKITGKLKSKNVLLKPFDKTRLNENLDFTEALL